MPTGKQPNIVVFFWDNFGWGELGCYGSGVLCSEPTVVAYVAVAHVGPRLTGRLQRGERPDSGARADAASAG